MGAGLRASIISPRVEGSINLKAAIDSADSGLEETFEKFINESPQTDGDQSRFMRTVDHGGVAPLNLEM